VIWTTLDGGIVYANKAVHELCGYIYPELIGTNFSELDVLLNTSDIGESGHITELVAQKQVTEISTFLRSRCGKYISVKLNLLVMLSPTARFAITVKRIFDDNKNAGSLPGDSGTGRNTREKLLTDELTGVWLRRRFSEVIAVMTENSNKMGSTLSMLFIDIDDFKVVNDNHGHNAGDCALRKVAEAIARAVRNEDILFRWGGDEFVVLLPGADASAAAAIAERIRSEVRSHSTEAGVTLTVSIGVASYEPGEDIVQSWLARADAMMYRAKNEGKDSVCVQTKC